MNHPNINAVTFGAAVAVMSFLPVGRQGATFSSNPSPFTFVHLVMKPTQYLLRLKD